MAKRPVFVTCSMTPYFKDEMTEFTYFSGFSLSQKQKCIDSLHEQYLIKHPNAKILEVSNKSKKELGVKLSAFNLMIEQHNVGSFSVESAFQSSKVFENGGPYKDLKYKTSKEAKKDPRLKSSGKLQYFLYGNRRFELLPTTFFYNWLYVNALALHPELSSQIIQYDAFTDIEFNPEKSINCQARSVALFVSLYQQNMLREALKNKDSFLEVVYGNESNTANNSNQLKLW